MTKYPRFKFWWLPKAWFLLFLLEIFAFKAHEHFEAGHYRYQPSLVYNKSKNGLNVRSGPGEQYKIIGTLEFAENVKRDSIIGEWSRIIHPPSGDTGYVKTSFTRINRQANYEDTLNFWWYLLLSILFAFLSYQLSLRHIIGYLLERRKERIEGRKKRRQERRKRRQIRKQKRLQRKNMQHGETDSAYTNQSYEDNEEDFDIPEGGIAITIHPDGSPSTVRFSKSIEPPIEPPYEEIEEIEEEEEVEEVVVAAEEENDDDRQ